MVFWWAEKWPKKCISILQSYPKTCKHPIQETTRNHGIAPSIELKCVCINYPSAQETLQLSHLCFFLRLKIANKFITGFPFGQGTLLQTAELVASSIGVSKETKITHGPKELHELTTHGVLSIIVPFHFIILNFWLPFCIFSHFSFKCWIRAFVKKCCNFSFSSL